MAKAKKSKKSKSAKIMFIVATLIFLASLGVVIGFSAMPYTAYTPYSLKDGDTTTYLYIKSMDEGYYVIADITDKGETPDPVDPIIKLNLKETLDSLHENDMLTPFVFQIKGSVAGITAETGKYMNVGNIAIVTVFAIVAAASLALALVNAKKAF